MRPTIKAEAAGLIWEVLGIENDDHLPKYWMFQADSPKIHVLTSQKLLVSVCANPQKVRYGARRVLLGQM